jgi:hypothetical protein
MDTDLSFITNEKNQSLKDRFEVLIKDTSFFDCLVGYFYTSGFHALYKSLEKTEKIRILIGISINRQVYDLLEKATKPKQQAIEFSHAETKEEVENLVEQELADSEDNRNVEEGVNKFIEWVHEDALIEIVQQESAARNRELIDEWSRGYSRAKKEDKFLTLAGIVSLLCRDVDYPHGEYLEQISDCRSLPIEKAKIPDRAYDMHTDRGRAMVRGLKHFFDEAASVKNERFRNDWEERGKEAHFQAQREGLQESDVIEAIKDRCQNYSGQEVLNF